MTAAGEIRREIVLPRRALQQPQPFVVAGGDCGPCSLAGVLGWTEATAVRRVYEDLCDGKADALSWYGMRGALYQAEARGELADLYPYPPTWTWGLERGPWGEATWALHLQWGGLLRVALAGGYYGIAEINHAGRGPYVATDHWVVLCGIRERRVPFGNGGARIDTDVLVSCSASGERWHEASEFLRTRGGFTSFLVRPAA